MCALRFELLLLIWDECVALGDGWMDGDGTDQSAYAVDDGGGLIECVKTKV